jgi:hypothetical protein
METQVKENVMLQKVEDYLESVSEHLFVTENEKFFKAFPIKIKDKLFCIKLEFDGLNSNYTRIYDINGYVEGYKSNSKHVISKMLFPQHYDKKISIPNFKVMREKMEEIKKFVEENFDGTNKQSVETAIQKMLVGIELKK